MRIAALFLSLALIPALFAAPPAPPPVSSPAPTRSELLFPAPPGTGDLRADPALLVGELANGVRYALRSNSEPRGRASLRLVVAAGSFHETEEQRGLAHFLEHMAFNGTENYPAGTLVEYFQRLGMRFGGDTNAYTFFDRTVYKIELPDTQPDTLAEGFRVLSDFAGRLLLPESEIDRERGVVLAEMLERDSADYRSAVASYQFFYDGTLLPNRLPIGLEEVLRVADRPRFVDFYQTWYRPERLAVIAIGDFDAATARAPLENAFSPLAAHAPPRPAPSFGTPASAELGGPVYGHHFEPEASSTTISFRVSGPDDSGPDRAGSRSREIPLELSAWIVNRRLAELAKAEDASFVRASASRDLFPRVFAGMDVSVVARPGRWADALRVGENELRRALEHGFLPAELREAVAEQRKKLEQAVKADPTRRSEQRADDLVDAFIEGRVPTTADDELALLGPTLDALTPADLHREFRRAWTESGALLVGVFGNTDLGVAAGARETIARVHAEAAALAVSPPAEIADQAWAYDDFGTPGTIRSRVEDPDLGITRLVFANGARLNLKPTAFEAGSIQWQARVGVGQLTEPATTPGLAFFADVAFTAGGLGRHSADELRRVLAGRNVWLTFRVDDDALVLGGRANAAEGDEDPDDAASSLRGRTTPADLRLQLELLTAYLVDPGFRPESEAMARRQLVPFYDWLATDPSGPLRIQVPRILASGDHRFGVPPREEAMARTLAELREWLRPQLSSGPLELALVGDFDTEAAIEAAAATIGALPPRNEKPALEKLRVVRSPEPGDHPLHVESGVAKAELALFWPTTDARDIHRTRRLGLLAAIFSDRLRKTVREELGGSYSPYALSSPHDTYLDYGFIQARVALDPAVLERVRPALLAVAKDLARNGVTEDELDRAKRPVLTAIRESFRDNEYWLINVLGNAQERPERLDWARHRERDFQSITKAELDTLAATYLAPERAIRFTVLAGPPTSAVAP